MTENPDAHAVKVGRRIGKFVLRLPAITNQVLQSPARRRIGKVLLRAVGVGLLLLTVLSAVFLCVGLKPWVAIPALWTGAFGSSAEGRLPSIAETLVQTCPLVLTGLGVTVAWQTGLFSIGGEGQALMGALAATAAAHLFPRMPGPILCGVMMLSGIAAGALWGGIAGYLRVRRSVQEVISTIMLNYIAISLLSWMVNGPLQEAGRHSPESDPIPAAAMFGGLLPVSFTQGVPTSLHTGVLLVIPAVLFVMILLYGTSTGFGMRLVGKNEEAARTAGFATGRLRMAAMLISGGLCGLAGAVELAGVTGRLYDHFSPGWGYTAVPVALLGGLHPLGVPFSALLFGAITTGTSELQQSHGVPSVIAYVIQAGVVLAILAVRALRTGGGRAVVATAAALPAEALHE